MRPAPALSPLAATLPNDHTDTNDQFYKIQNMTSYKDIEKKIYKGLQDTCVDAINFNGTFDAEVKPEYLITMNIAKAIGELNFYPGSPFLIRPEEQTKVFATRCVPNIVWEDIFAPTIFRTAQNTDRNGRFDIAVYEGDTEKPLTAIEVKLINPTEDYIKDDIKRLSELLHLKDKQTGNSKIKHTYFTCIELNEEIKFETETPENIKVIKAKYNGWVQNILTELSKENTIYSDTKFEIAALSIDKSLLLTPEKRTGDDIFDGDLYSQAKHFVGVIVRLTKKSSS